MSKNRTNKMVIDMDNDDCEVKLVFDDDNTTQQVTDLSSSLVKKDHFQQQTQAESSGDKKNKNQRNNNMHFITENHFQQNRKLSDPLVKYSDDLDELQDGFSEILVDPNALQRRQRLTNINLMAKSDVGFKVINQEDDSNELVSNSSLGSSMINNSNSLIANSASNQKADKLSVNLEYYKIKVFDVNDFQKGPECCVCKSKFGLFSLRVHHCRFCSMSCCQHCSAKRINSHRSCDICFITIAIKTNSGHDNPYLNTFRKDVEFYSKYEKLAEEQNKILISQYENMINHCEYLSTKQWKMQQQVEQTQKEREDQIIEHGKQLRDILYDRIQKQQDIKNMKGILDSKISQLEEKKKLLYQLEQRLKRQREDNLMKLQALDTKQKKLNRLYEKQDELQQKHNLNQKLIERDDRSSSTLNPSLIYNHDHFNIFTNNTSNRSQSVYDTRDNTTFNTDLKGPTYEQQEFEQIQNIKNKRCYTLNSEQYDDFEPKTHNVAPKKEKKMNMCLNRYDYN
ncbi:hypothetical protein TTHERM_00485840 (macronuclear) [Tetrahymena thermophila SB210]|uniref:FYVE-type domain-containing protein n=1 Tax=Tetrahymena thermophila (strain SB210) TaxID=312017 RepID=I7LTF2_TETTS|nr:hypothetical protein TTHERM_00485840 [Tetrahymena thermophila SB210]EAR85134.1 hypothetical protein TTHERM_00485840 [Tetrahymena thermophila SB210]|eukprot:XP_001032797.1 hypothetical protein TTHERM_00485840 [Tetrahymena thermophila SB210]